MLFTSPMKRMTEKKSVTLNAKDDCTPKEVCKDRSARSSRILLTPETEASTPESVHHDRNTSKNDEDINDDDTNKCSKNENLEISSYEEHSQLQRHYSQTDNHIHLLDRNGDLNEVAGSQSMLSQELFDHHHDSEEDQEHSKENVATRRAPQAGGSFLEDLGLTKGSKSHSSMGIAKKLGLLTQTQDEDDVGEETNDANSPGNKHQERPSMYHNGTDQLPLSGLDLLTQVGIKEANKTEALATTGLRQQETKPHLQGSSSVGNEGFGSLLDAVAKITEQETSDGVFMEWQDSPSSSESKKKSRLTKRKRNSPSQTKPKRPSPKVQRKSETQKLKEKLRKEKIDQENKRAQDIAKRAAIIAERTITDPIIAKKLLLSMALARENPRSVPQNLPGKGHVVQKSFFWAHYPPLEHVLKKHMAEYYELSTHQCQSRQQQAFNNYMVGVVKDVAEKQQWKFADTFCDKSLRDRIRCYYKTHIQNAKKRLRTMVRNPTKKANARHLCEHLDLIEKHRVDASK